MLNTTKRDAMIGAAAMLFAAIMSVTFVSAFSDLGNRPTRLDPVGAYTAAAPKLRPGAWAPLTIMGAGYVSESVATAHSSTAAGQGGDAAVAEGADPPEARHQFTSMPTAPTSPLVASVDSGTSDRLIVVRGGFGYYLTPGLVWSRSDVAGGTPGFGDGTSVMPTDGGDGRNGSPDPPPAGAVGGGNGDGGVLPVIPPGSPGSDSGPDNGNGGVPPSLSPVPVPEPPQIPLMLLGLLTMGGLLCLRRRRRRA